MSEPRAKLLLRLAKVRRMALESPVQGERAAAQRQLSAAMERHGVAEEELKQAASQLEPQPPRPALPQPTVIIFTGWAWGGFSTTSTGATTTGWRWV